MKKYVFIAIALGSLIGCTNSDDFFFNDKQKAYSEYASKNITHNEALDIASDVIDGSAFIHCDWGWGGNSNGYYSGAVFNAQGYNFKPSKFFAIKRTK